MKKYIKPIIEDEEIELEDVIAKSTVDLDEEEPYLADDDF